MRKNLLPLTVVALAFPVYLALAADREPLSIPEHVKQLQREVEDLKASLAARATPVLDSGKHHFPVPAPDECGSKQDPCKIYFNRRFEQAPHCVLTAWNPDGTTFEENVVIEYVAPDHMSLWRGKSVEGTSIIVSWICVEPTGSRSSR